MLGCFLQSYFSGSFCTSLAFCFRPLSSVVACFPRVGQEMNMKGMPRTMLVRIQFPRVFLALLLLSFAHLPASNAQNVEPFKFFRDYVGLKEDQIAAIRNGKAVAKVVESRTPDEVFVFGSVYVQSTPEKYLKLASDIDALRKLPS